MALSTLPTQEELEKIREFILLPILVDVVNKNRSQLQHDQTPLKGLFLAATDVLLDRIIADHVRIKKEIKSGDIKVIEKDDPLAQLNCEYICRGYNDNFSMKNEQVKLALAVLLGKYVGEIGKALREVI